MILSSSSPRYMKDTLPAALTIFLAVLALAAGWILKSWVTSQSQPYRRAGVSAYLPLKWLVNNGLAGEELVFSANPPFDFNLSYQVRLLPAVPQGKITDLVVRRNLSQGRALAFYTVLSQQAVQFGGRDGYQVTYAYVRPGAKGELPVTISGTDTYLDGSEKVLLVTYENTASHFEETLPGFNRFVRSVSYQKEGGQ